MSYSFYARGATKAAVIAALAVKFDDVVASQPVHAADRPQAEAAAAAFLGVLPDDAGEKDFYVSVSGSVSWTGTLDVDAVIVTAGVNVSASLVVKESA